MRYTAEFTKLSGPNKGQIYSRYFNSQSERDVAVERQLVVLERHGSMEKERIYVTIARLSREEHELRKEWKMFEAKMLERTPNPTDKLKAEIDSRREAYYKTKREREVLENEHGRGFSGEESY